MNEMSRNGDRVLQEARQLPGAVVLVRRINDHNNVRGNTPCPSGCFRSTVFEESEAAGDDVPIMRNLDEEGAGAAPHAFTHSSARTDNEISVSSDRAITLLEIIGKMR